MNGRVTKVLRRMVTQMAARDKVKATSQHHRAIRSWYNSLPRNKRHNILLQTVKHNGLTVKGVNA